MAIDDYFGMDAQPDRMIGDEWHTWVTTPDGSGSMQPYTSLPLAEQLKLAAGRDYGANIYTTEEKKGLDSAQANEIYNSYDPELRAKLEAIGQTPPPGGFDQAPAPTSPMAPGPVQPAPGVTPPPMQGPAPSPGVNPAPPGVETYQNPNDFADWQTAAANSLRADPKMGMVTGGPAGSYGGGAIWNKVLQNKPDAPTGAMANQRFGAYDGGPTARPESPMAPPPNTGNQPDANPALSPIMQAIMDAGGKEAFAAALRAQAGGSTGVPGAIDGQAPYAGGGGGGGSVGTKPR